MQHPFVPGPSRPARADRSPEPEEEVDSGISQHQQQQQTTECKLPLLAGKTLNFFLQTHSKLSSQLAPKAGKYFSCDQKNSKSFWAAFYFCSRRKTCLLITQIRSYLLLRKWKLASTCDSGRIRSSKWSFPGWEHPFQNNVFAFAFFVGDFWKWATRLRIHSLNVEQAYYHGTCRHWYLVFYKRIYSAAAVFMLAVVCMLVLNN